MNYDYLKTIKTLKDENSMLKDKISILENKFNWLEQDKMQNVVEILGIPDDSSVSASDLAKKAFSDGLNINILDEQIEKCYTKKIKNNKVALYVKFVSYDTKKLILKSKFSRKKNLTHLFLVEITKTIFI